MPTETFAPPTTATVVLAEPIGDEGRRLLAEHGLGLVDCVGKGREELLAAVETADALLVRSGTKVDRELIGRAKRLKVIGRAGVGVDNVDVPAATERGILVVNSPSGNTTAAVEQTFAMLLGLMRRVPEAVASLRRGEWKRAQFVGQELEGKVFGVVGLGRIGSRVASRAEAFGCQVIGHDPFLTPERIAELGMPVMAIDELLAKADIVSLHMPYEPGTPPLVGRERLALMKPTAIIVNCARGGLIDEVALAEALQAKRLGGAAIDVFSEEPPPKDHPLLSIPSAIVTPHLGASTEEAQRRVALEVVETVLAALSGSLAVPAVNLPFGPSGPELRPLLELARALGALGAGMLAEPVAEVAIEVHGLPERSVKAASAAAVAGALSSALGEDVNLVSALPLAKGRGIRVFDSHRDKARDYANRVTVKVSGAGRAVAVQGTLFSDRLGRVVAVDGFLVEFDPQGWVLAISNRNVPGVVGKVGTVLGERGVNIADMALARHPAGETAMAMITTDRAPAPGVLEALRAIPEITDVRLVRL